MDKLFLEQAKKIRVYLSLEKVEDPYEKNVSHTLLNSLPCPAIITDLTASQSAWKMMGVTADKTKEIIIPKRYRSLIEKSQKIEINGEFYQGWKISGKMQVREEGNYCRIYCYIKKV